MSRALGIAWPGELTMLDGLAGVAPADADPRPRPGRRCCGATCARRRASAGSPTRGPRTLLRELWVEGGDLTPEGIARELGAGGLDAAALADEAG